MANSNENLWELSKSICNAWKLKFHFSPSFSLAEHLNLYYIHILSEILLLLFFFQSMCWLYSSIGMCIVCIGRNERAQRMLAKYDACRKFSKQTHISQMCSYSLLSLLFSIGLWMLHLMLFCQPAAMVKTQENNEKRE